MEDKRDVLKFVILIMREFSRRNSMSVPDSFEYLNKYKGINFLVVHYGIEHTLSLDEVIEEVSQICINNGGNI